MDQGQQNGRRKVARATFSCQGHLRGKAPHPDKKMWAWQLFLAHFVGPGPFLASGQLSLVVRGGRDIKKIMKDSQNLQPFLRKVHFGSNWSKIGVSGAKIATIKRRAPKNDSERRWNFVKWTNDDPIFTRKLLCWI